MQDKKKAEADKQKELNDLFAIAIKQPKVPPGERCYSVAVWLFAVMAVPCLFCLLSASDKPYQAPKPGSTTDGGTIRHILEQAASVFHPCLPQLGSEPTVFRPAAGECNTAPIMVIIITTSSVSCLIMLNNAEFALTVKLGISGHQYCQIKSKKIQQRESLSWMPACCICSCGCLQVLTPNL